MELYPAVDIRKGAAVRLEQGDFAQETSFGNPIELARRYADAGASWVHVVDLDGARSGSPVNRSVVLEIARSVKARVQTGGGVRTRDDAHQLIEGGVERVVLGTVALSEPELVSELAGAFPGRIAVGLDHRDGGSDVAVHGWRGRSGTSLDQALGMFADVELAAFVVTTIERDGVKAGPDIEGLRNVLLSTRHHVIASGGVSSAGDLAELGALRAQGRRLSGVVVGRALADGTLRIEEAIAACAASA